MPVQQLTHSLAQPNLVSLSAIVSVQNEIDSTCWVDLDEEVRQADLEGAAVAGIVDPDIDGAHLRGCAVDQTLHTGRAANITVNAPNPDVSAHLPMAHPSALQYAANCG